MNVGDSTGPPLIDSKYPLYVERILSSSSNLTAMAQKEIATWKCLLQRRNTKNELTDDFHEAGVVAVKEEQVHWIIRTIKSSVKLKLTIPNPTDHRISRKHWN